MNPEFLSRLQFALTASFHFIFLPISMGLGILLVWMAWKHVRTGDPVWRQSSVFWVKVRPGVRVGDRDRRRPGVRVRDELVAVLPVRRQRVREPARRRGRFAFALEGGFLGLMLFGGDRLGPRMWLLATFLVVFGAHFSALWILMANSWMQTPQGFTTA